MMHLELMPLVMVGEMAKPGLSHEHCPKTFVHSIT